MPLVYDGDFTPPVSHLSAGPLFPLFVAYFVGDSDLRRLEHHPGAAALPDPGFAAAHDLPDPLFCRARAGRLPLFDHARAWLRLNQPGLSCC